MKRIALSIFLLMTTTIVALAQQGAYIEYKITSPKAGVTGSIKTSAQDGNTRSEFYMASPQIPSGFGRITMTLKANPNKSYILNEKIKSYSEMELTGATTAREDDPAEYEVTVIGKEKVNGYNCTHVKLKLKSATSEQEMWLSTEVLNYKMYQSVKSKYTNNGLFKALEAKGVTGFPVRTMATEQGGSMQIDLVKAQMQNFSPATFSLTGYQKEAAAPATSVPADIQEMVKKMQSMTPEERQKMIEKIRESQQAKPH